MQIYGFTTRRLENERFSKFCNLFLAMDVRGVRGFLELLQLKVDLLICPLKTSQSGEIKSTEPNKKNLFRPYPGRGHLSFTIVFVSIVTRNLIWPVCLNRKATCWKSILLWPVGLNERPRDLISNLFAFLKKANRMFWKDKTNCMWPGVWSQLREKRIDGQSA